MRTRRSQRGWVAGVLLVATFGVSGPASAQALCDDINHVTGYKIVLDDIQFGGAASDAQAQAQARTLMRLFISQLGSRLEDLPDAQATRYHLVPCPGRVPEGEASFPPLTVKDLVNRDVLLEVWGEAFPPSGGKQKVFLTYVMMPLPRGDVSPFLRRQYQPNAGSSPDELVEWLANLNELSAYAMVARAVRLVGVNGPGSYDSAKADLETAAATLRQAFGATPSGAQTSLLAFIAARKCAILRDAKTNTAYKGALSQIPNAIVAQQCPAGGPQ